MTTQYTVKSSVTSAQILAANKGLNDAREQLASIEAIGNFLIKNGGSEEQIDTFCKQAKAIVKNARATLAKYESLLTKRDTH